MGCGREALAFTGTQPSMVEDAAPVKRFVLLLSVLKRKNLA
jgi:hypothetical protein